MRWSCLLILWAGIAVAPAVADDADDYFEVGLDYLRKGFFDRSRAAFAESLVRAPHEPVTLAFLGIAVAAEGGPPRVAASVLRSACAQLGKRETLRLNLTKLLPRRQTLTLLHREYQRNLKRAKTMQARRAILEVLAFLEVSDGTPETAPSLKLLDPESDYAKALARKPATTPAP